MISSKRWSHYFLLSVMSAFAVCTPSYGQGILGSITGTVKDVGGGGVADAVVKAHNTSTNLEVTTKSKASGDYTFLNLPVGQYVVTFTKDGFEIENHSNIDVTADRTATVDGALQPGAVGTTVEVTGTPLLNQVDTTVGYVLDERTIQNTPLGTGSFTQLAILSPGVNADVLNGSGSNAGLGNQPIWANGQRDTSNSFSINGVNANNIFNGKSSSQVSSSRFTANTGQSSAGDGDTRTNTSVYDAIGQALPTPPQEAIQEIRVDTSQYDASHSPNSGAHIEVLTKSGGNNYHGALYEYFQNNDMNAAPFFRNADTSLPPSQKVPALHYNRFGATFGGPVIKDKLFFFVAYQGIQDSDALAATSKVTVPSKLTDDRTANGLATAFGVAPSTLSPVSIAMLGFKLPNGSYLLPTPTINAAVGKTLGYNVLLQDGSSIFKENLGIANADYNVSNSNRLTFHLMDQDTPTTSPFGLSQLEGFPETLSAGGALASLIDTWALKPNLTLGITLGAIRQRAYANMSQPLTPSSVGINLFGSPNFPGVYIYHPDTTVSTSSLTFGPDSNFSNAGIFQNKFQGGANLNWIHGRHSLYFGFDLDHSQLNVINKNNQVAAVEFDSGNSFGDFLSGTNLYAPYSYYFTGASNRYYRATQAGAFVQDKVRLSSTLNLSVGLRWDWDGPLSEKYGLMTNFYPSDYQYNAATDTVTNSGIVVAGNNKTLGTPGVSDSTMLGRQWGLGPRIGLAWSPHAVKNVVVRAGYGIYYDRGEFFTEFSPGAGRGFSGPFGVTLQLPFTSQISSTSTSTLANPFGSIPAPPPTNAAAITQLLPNAAGISKGASTYLFSAYDPYNTLPYTENWSFDIQWQPANSWLATLGYVGNKGLHETLPIPFNQPNLATSSNPINGQTLSYGFNAVAAESLKTYDGGNTDLRVPYLGFSTNSMLFEAEGISTYNALQASLQKHFSKGLQFTAAYTWSHSLDEQSNLGLFYNGNNPTDPRQSYASSTFDRTHVFITSYMYQLPKPIHDGSMLSKFTNGWAVAGVTTLQSGQPYNAYDYSGAVAGIYYGTTVSILDPVIGLAPGVTAKQAELQGTTGINPSLPSIDGSKFYIPVLPSGTNGIAAGDNVETGFASSGRNMFRGPFQERFDISLMKETRLNDRYTLSFSGQLFNVFNHPVFDVPNVSLSQYSGNPPVAKAVPSSFGLITGTLGSPRFVQISMHLTF